MNPLAFGRRAVNTAPILAVFVSVFLWGVGPLMYLATNLTINSVIFYRVIMWPPLLIFIVMRNGGRITKQTLRVTLLPGLLFGLSTVTGFTAIAFTSVANATIIGNISSALVLLVAPKLFGERITGLQIIFAISSFAGIVTVVLGSGGTGGATIRGDFLALLNAVTWMMYFLTSKIRRTDGINTWEFLAGVSLAQLLVAVPYAVITSKDLGNISLRDAGIIMLMTLLPGTVGHGLMVWAQKFVDASVSSLILLLGPVISAIGGWLVYDQKITIIQAIGGVVVLVSLAGVVRYSASQRVNREVLSTADPLLNSNP